MSAGPGGPAGFPGRGPAPAADASRPAEPALASGLEELLDFGAEADYERLDLPPPARREGLLRLEPEAAEALAARAFREINHRVPAAVLEAWAAILRDPEASPGERFVAASLVRNAAVAAEGLLPLCQDTGTAICHGWLAADAIGDITPALARGASAAYRAGRFRASQLAPSGPGFLAESNTGDNSPALVDLRAGRAGTGLRLCFAAKGGGSQNRTSLAMESPALLEPGAMRAFLEARVRGLGTSGCPPYRISFVAGGQSPDEALHALALAGLGLLDGLRDPDTERLILELAEATGYGAQFGGRRLAMDARAVRLPRHAASLPLAFGVACAAFRRARALVDESGWRLERLEADPARFLPAELPVLPEAVRIDLGLPLPRLAEELSRIEAGSFVLLSGPVVLARDAAHARFAAALARGEGLPAYLRERAVFYAGPTEAAPGASSGSFGPTTASRMDAYLPALLARGASLVTIAKGERSKAARDALGEFKGSYLAAIGGAAALAAREHVLSSRVIDHADLGMEAVRLVELRDLPAVLAVDARGRSRFD